MTNTAPVASAQQVSPAATTNVATQQLAGNFNTFLKLLTTQLQNQDPTSPMDSNQFTQQLVEFSQVEQQINTNQNLQTLINQGQSANGAYAMSYLGRSVTISNGQAALQKGAAAWDYTLGTTAQATTLTVSDSSGRVVYTGAGETTSGAHSFSWDGKDINGNQLPDGTYTLNVGATAQDGSTVSTAVTSTGVVSEVNLSGGTPTLMIGPMSVPLTAVSDVGT
jgi:flagellar basal-body rod modification protein FlgD